MARTSIAAGKAELFDLLDGNVDGVTRFFDHEPNLRDHAKPVSLTISTAGMDSEFYRYAVRIWQTAERNAKKDQDELDVIVLVADLLIRSGFVVEEWSTDFNEDAVAYVCTGIVTCGREDDLYQ